MQMYEGLPVVTNKISVEEQRGIPHHLLGQICLDEPAWHAHVFSREAKKTIREIRSRGRLPIVVGGTHYYADALLFEGSILEGPDSEDSTDPTAAAAAAALATAFPVLDGPTEDMVAKLREVDPEMADRWHPKRPAEDPPVARDLPDHRQGRPRRRTPISSAGRRPGSGRRTWARGSRSCCGCTPSPTCSTAALGAGFDQMLEKGLLNETQQMYGHLHDRLGRGEAVDRTKGIWQSIGFRQVEPYLDGLGSGLSAAELEGLKRRGVDDVKTATRRYAKGQLRWLKYKTIPLIKGESVLDHLFVLDSTDTRQWDESVARRPRRSRGCSSRGGELPAAAGLSETAREVLSSVVDARRADDSKPCHRKCEVCHLTTLTEQAWDDHLRGNRHRRLLRQQRKAALVPIDPADRHSAVPPPVADAGKAAFPEIEALYPDPA